MTKQYDIALAKYYDKLKTVSLPLTSWDIFSTPNLEISHYNIIQKNWKSKVNFREIVYREKREIIITNLNQEIVFASEGIYKMNGYKPFELKGKSPKMLQGSLTCQNSTNNIRKAIQNHLPFKEVILNYKKDGTTYLCEIEVFPKFNNKGVLVNYIAFERIAS
jgi:PAS domain S-box-containing protein